MKWQNILNRKRNTALALAVVLVTMLLLTLVHRWHLSELQNAMSSIYVDRLVAESHLYELSHEIYEKKMLVSHYEDGLLEENIRVNDSIQQLLTKYEQTYLTDEEGQQLSELKDHIRLSQQYEQQFLYGASPSQREALRPGLTNHYDSILASLNDLTKLQLQEGRKLMDQSKRIVASNNMTLRLAIGVLVVLGLLIYLVFTPAPISLRHTYSENLN